MEPVQNGPRRVLIASANPLFREGLRKAYATRWGERAEIVAMPASTEEALAALEQHQPDLAIIDHDDRAMNQADFLNRFVAGQSPMKVVLVSLASTGPVVIYDRRQMTSAQADDWLADPWANPLI